jgi:pyruvate/2-oxoglutarate dehydrogenase complex dihydrolipoamide acyltransferase (E2) component
MPNLGYDMERGRIAAWLRAPGDHVDRGEPLAEIETDKATVEMEAVQSGVLAEIVAPAGSEAAIGDVIAYLDGDE